MRAERLKRYRWHGLDAVQLCGVAFTALMLIPAGAHLFELNHKIGLAPADYMLVQGIYRGWSLFGFAVAGALASVGLHAFFVHRNRAAFSWSIAALACILGTQFVFWIYTYPINVETANWKQMPVDFESARQQWEYSHAVASVLSFAALLAFMRSIELSRPFASIGILESIERDAAVRAARERALAQSPELERERRLHAVGSHW